MAGILFVLLILIVSYFLIFGLPEPKRCPKCGGALSEEYDKKKFLLRCRSCGRVFDG
jgi:rRNA maturation endonuclease Nob1